MHKIDVAANTITWTDPDLVTQDKQPIGLEVSVTYARKRDSESVVMMWERFNKEARNDEELVTLVLAMIPRGAKAVTTKYTLDEMLGIGDGAESAGRAAVANDLFSALEEELSEFGVELIDVGINNISPDPDFLNLLKQKANAAARVELAQQETLQLEEQLKQEKAQTEIDLEKANRENLVAQERGNILETNEEYYRLEYLTKLERTFGENDKVWFLDPNMDLTILFSDTSPAVVPIPK